MPTPSTDTRRLVASSRRLVPVQPARPRPIYFVRAPAGAELPEPAVLRLYLRRWVLRELCGWAQLAVHERVADGRVEWSEDSIASRALAGGAPARERILAVRCEDRRGPRRPGLWTALCVAEALAELLGGELVDARRGWSVSAARLRPPADARVRTVDHLWVPSSRGGDRRRWLSTVGMGGFGLPELELVDVSDRAAQIGARLLLGVAQHMIDAAWTPPRVDGPARELLLTHGELFWALGGEQGVTPRTRGRGWTRVLLEVDHGRAWPELLRLCPPFGSRNWRSTGAWLRDAWSDLFGPPEASARRVSA